jgi:hypothetical protein
MRRSGIVASWALVLILGAVGSAAASAQTAERPWDPYEILVTRNIFSQVRGRRALEAQRQEEPNPERFVYLRGVMRRAQGFVALLEDTRSGQVISCRSGDHVVRGEVKEVTLDGIRYVQDGAEVAVSVGENLEKGAPAVASGQAAGSAQAAPRPASGAAADALEKMRQRRQQELGK